jgi:hypothetical protein
MIVSWCGRRCSSGHYAHVPPGASPLRVLTTDHEAPGPCPSAGRRSSPTAAHHAQGRRARKPAGPGNWSGFVANACPARVVDTASEPRSCRSTGRSAIDRRSTVKPLPSGRNAVHAALAASRAAQAPVAQEPGRTQDAPKQAAEGAVTPDSAGQGGNGGRCSPPLRRRDRLLNLRQGQTHRPAAPGWETRPYHSSTVTLSLHGI